MRSILVVALLALTMATGAQTRTPNQIMRDVDDAERELRRYRRTLVGTDELSETSRTEWLGKISALQTAVRSAQQDLFTTAARTLRRSEQDFQALANGG